MRILIVTHAPLSPEFGAGQMAINLAEAFREQGYDVTLWSPHPLPSKTKWWQKIQQMQSKLHEFIETQKPFDLIDSPPILITRKVSILCPFIVSRNVQPPILYIASSLNNRRMNNLKDIVRVIFNYFYSIFLVFLVLKGWSKAKHIFCLGNIELQWMRKWFPFWEKKLSSYVNALSQSDQKALAKIRLYRDSSENKNIQFLWIGRWSNQKGITELLDFIDQRLVLFPQDTFTIAGCGDKAEKDIPSKLIRSCKLTIIPSFDRNQLYCLLAKHNVGLFTSKVEGWGLILTEMLESGMTVFSTSVGGSSDLQPFFEDTLRPFPPPLNLKSNSLKKLEFNQDYYKMFSWSQIAKKYIELLFN